MKLKALNVSAASKFIRAECPDCGEFMSHKSDYSYHLLDYYSCPKCGCNITVLHTKEWLQSEVEERRRKVAVGIRKYNPKTR